MTNLISNVCAIASSALINVHCTTNLQSFAKEDMDVFWTMHFQEHDASRYQHVINGLFIDPWVFDMPDINLNRIPRATIVDRPPAYKHPLPYPLQ